MDFSLGIPPLRRSRFRSWLRTVWVFGIVGPVLAELPPPLVQNYDLPELGGELMTWNTVQTSDGLLHVGADVLLNFDGTRWTQAAVDGSYCLRGLAVGADGQLWAAARNEIGWFDQTAAGAWNYHSLVGKLPPEHALPGDSWQAFADGRGALFITANRVLRWDGERFQVWFLPGAGRIQGCRSGDQIFVSHPESGLYRMTASGPELVIPADSLGNAMVTWVEASADAMTLATRNGIFQFRDHELTRIAPEVSAYIEKNRLNCATRLPDGRLAIGTYLGGIAIMDQSGAFAGAYTERDGLPTNCIYALFVDREKNLWVNSPFSVFRLKLDSPSTLVRQLPSTQKRAVIRITRHAGKLFAASRTQLSVLNPVTDTFEAVNVTMRNIQDLTSSPVGLLAAVRGAIRQIQGDEISTMVPTDGAGLIRPSRMHPGRYLLVENETVALVGTDGSRKLLVHQLPDGTNSIAEDDEGRLWLGTNSRAVLVALLREDEVVEARPAADVLGFPDRTGDAFVVLAPNHAILVASRSGGWILPAGKNAFSRIEKFPAWPVNAVSEILPDGQWWLAHPSSENRAATIARVTVNGDTARWDPHSVDGLGQIGVTTALLAEPGEDDTTVLWLGGTNGFLRTSTPRTLRAPVPDAPVVRATVRPRISEVVQPLVSPLPFSTRTIAFDFAAPSFATRPTLRIETLLEGVDRSWQPAGTETRREFTALRDGQYTFRARVVAATGVIGAENVVTFTISPPWWRTGAALCSGLLALLPAGYGLYQWRVRRLRDHNAELERKVQERTVELEKASAAKSEFVANMSHDIRNPLNGIVGLALALEDTVLDAKQRELITTLRECTSYLSTLVDDVLDFASIEAGRIDLRPAPFAPAELLQSLAMMFKVEAIASGAVLTVEADPRLPATYVGDAGRIQQVLVNFISNALKYAGGPVHLSVEIPDDAPEEIEFSVTDQGPGIAPDRHQQLFHKFSRLTDVQSKEITGTGLGLASCRLLAGLMSGSVGVESERGEGARFFLRLPLDIFPTPVIDSPTVPVTTGLLPNCSVLLVEDTNYNAMAAAAVLGKFGLTCERAANGAEALRLFAEQRFHLVLLDRNLPDMDGTEVARQIRRLEADGPRAIILAVTAYCTQADRALCLSAGMDAFVGKPLTPQKLRRVLAAAGRRHLAAASMHVAPELAAEAKIDVSLLEYISDGTDQGLNRQIDLFLTALGDAEKQLQSAAAATDFKLVAEAAHAVLSHARLVGSAALATAASGLQSCALAHDPAAFGAPLTQVYREIETLTAAVRRHPGAERTM